MPPARDSVASQGDALTGPPFRTYLRSLPSSPEVPYWLRIVIPFGVFCGITGILILICILNRQIKKRRERRKKRLESIAMQNAAPTGPARTESPSTHQFGGPSTHRAENPSSHRHEKPCPDRPESRSTHLQFKGPPSKHRDENRFRGCDETSSTDWTESASTRRPSLEMPAPPYTEVDSPGEPAKPAPVVTATGRR